MGATTRYANFNSSRLLPLRIRLCAYAYIVFLFGAHWSDRGDACKGQLTLIRRLTKPSHRTSYTRAMTENEEGSMRSARDIAAGGLSVADTHKKRAECPGGKLTSTLLRRLLCGTVTPEGNTVAVSSGFDFDSAANAAAAPSESARATQFRIYHMMQDLHRIYPRMTSSSQMRRTLNPYLEETHILGQEALASLVTPMTSREQHLEVIQSLFPSGEKVLVNSAFAGRNVEVSWENGFLSALIDDGERRYRPFLLCNDFRKDISENVLKGIEETLASEVQIPSDCKLDSLEAVQRKYHMLTLKDVVLLPGRRPLLVSSNLVCANAVLLYDETVTSLSGVLPLTIGHSSPMLTNTLEAARLSLFLQIAGIVGTLAADGLVLPRFSTDAFFIKASGTVYIKSHPQPRRISSVDRAPKLRRFPLPGMHGRSTLTRFFDTDVNAVDLATVLYSLWCPVKDCILGPVTGASAARIRTTAAFAARSTTLPPRVLVFIQDLLSGILTTERILYHFAYIDLREQLEEWTSMWTGPS